MGYCKPIEKIKHIQLTKNTDHFKAYRVHLYFKNGNSLLWKTFFRRKDAVAFTTKYGEFLDTVVVINL